MSLTQYRFDEGTRKINAQVTNEGSDPFTVTSVELMSPVLASLAPTTENTVVAPGQTIDLQTAYADPDCDATSTGRAAFLLNLQGQAALSVQLDRRGQALLDRLYARECALARIADVASVSFGPSFTRVRVDGEPYLRGELLVTRWPNPDTRDVSLTVDSFAGSVLVTLLPQRGAEALPATLDAGAGSLRVPILIGSSNRCDAHARGQSTQTFLLSVFVHVAGAATQRVILVPDKASQRQALAVVDAACHTRHG